MSWVGVEILCATLSTAGETRALIPFGINTRNRKWRGGTCACRSDGVTRALPPCAEAVRSLEYSAFGDDTCARRN